MDEIHYLWCGFGLICSGPLHLIEAEIDKAVAKGMPRKYFRILSEQEVDLHQLRRKL